MEPISFPWLNPTTLNYEFFHYVYTNKDVPIKRKMHLKVFGENFLNLTNFFSHFRHNWSINLLLLIVYIYNTISKRLVRAAYDTQPLISYVCFHLHRKSVSEMIMAKMTTLPTGMAQTVRGNATDLDPNEKI
jgi:hypothetical protein